jgi:predicted RNA-binding protein with PUA-like domain
VVVDVQAGEQLATPVPLARLRADPRFADSPLVRQGRLSVVPLTDAQYAAIRELAGSG